MFGHIMLGTNDLDTSMVFYDETMPVLGYTRVETGDGYAQYGRPEDVGTGLNCLFVGRPLDRKPASPGNGVNIALLAQTRQQVIDFHRIVQKGIHELWDAFCIGWLACAQGCHLIAASQTMVCSILLLRPDVKLQ